MKKSNALAYIAISVALIVFSCGKDDGPEQKTPTIDSFTPTSGPINTTLIIEGENFGASIAANTVTLNNITVELTNASTTKLTGKVPDGASTGKIKVSTSEGTATSTQDFTVTTEENNTTLSLDKTNLILYPYEHYSETLVATTNVDNPSITWVSSDNEVASVDQNGKIIPLAIGNTTITASINGVDAECSVAVVDGPVTSLMITPQIVELYTGESEGLELTIEAAVESTSAPVWSSENPEIASVDDEGNITANAVGTAEITVQVDNLSTSIPVKINPNVYIGGYGNTGDTSSDIGVIWKNGIPTKVSGEYRSRIEDIFVDDNHNVYAVGYQVINNKIVGTIWIDGNPTVLTSETYISFATGIYYENGTIYVVGHSDENNDNKDRIFLWTKAGANSQWDYITDGANNANASDVLVKEGSVYISGFEYNPNKNNNIAKVWTNGQGAELNNGDNSAEALSLTLNNLGVPVVAGFEEYDGDNSTARIWINGLGEYLADGLTSSYGYSVAIDAQDNNYVIGHLEKNGVQYVGKLWKNQQEISEFADDTNDTFAYSIALSDANVHVVGYSNGTVNNALYWVNNDSQVLQSDDDLINTRAHSIFLK
ncbi:MAG: Ig-like domain-containing protein [Flavobacteriaceae bacterium]|uniref:Ig-like domain-containing protein n=1 Tax=Flagellimonas sp. SN16 TaxID=3415142 RepID=UPI003C4AC295|nr:Ig-like domain-containing protein [Flavobacteriaceae bacterium]